MANIRRILCAVRNPDARRQPGVDKAAAIAKALGARLELYHAISDAVFLDLYPLSGNTAAELQKEAHALRRRRLEKAAARARRLGVDVTCEVAWDHPPHEAVVRRAVRTGADLIVAEFHRGSRGWLMQMTDWELLRHSPVPVLLLRTSRPWRKPVILAAVDPNHAHAKPADLDRRVLASARGFAQATGGRVDVLHVSQPKAAVMVSIDPGIDTATLAAAYEQMSRQARVRFTEFADAQDIPRARRHVLEGDPARVIQREARALGASLVVMGAVSRSGLKRLFIGNTAERVLREVPCDVLVVKPAEFRSRVKPKSRGMKVVASAPLVPLPV